MLTSDLVRVRVKKGVVEPRYINVEKAATQDKAAKLIEIYEAHVDKPRGDLEEAIRDHIGQSTDYLVQRGLSKLLSDRSDFEVVSPIDPREIRRALFERVMQVHPVATVPDLYHTTRREDVIAEVAEHFELTPAQVEASFYADLQDAYILRSFKSLTPERLLHRYNLALAQAVLFKATQLRIELADTNAKRMRQLMRYLKFFKLIASVRKVEGAYHFAVDGPLSIFRFCQKYGLQMASFLPALLLCDNWELEAELIWDDKRSRARFCLDSESALVSHYPDKGTYITEEEKYFRKRWKALKLPWLLKPSQQIVRLGSRDTMVVDYKLTHPDGHEVLLEIVGFWHRASLMRKLELIAEYGPDNLILAVPARLRVSQEELPDFPGALYFFKDVIIPKRVAALADEVVQDNMAQKKESTDS